VAKSIVAIQVLIKTLVNKKDAAGYLLNLITNCSLLLDNRNQMIPHGALMLAQDQVQLHQLQEVTAMFLPLRNLTAESLAPLKKTAKQVAAAGTQHLIHLVLQILHGATTRKVLTLAQHQLGMLKIQDSLMISLL
jgi:hypothetical protein